MTTLEQLLRNAMNEQADLLPGPSAGLGRAVIRRANRVRRAQVAAVTASVVAAVGAVGVAAGQVSNSGTAAPGGSLTTAPVAAPSVSFASAVPVPETLQVTPVAPVAEPSGAAASLKLTRVDALLDRVTLLQLAPGFPYVVGPYAPPGYLNGPPIGGPSWMRRANVWTVSAEQLPTGPPPSRSVSTSQAPTTPYAQVSVQDGPLILRGSFVRTLTVTGRAATLRSDDGMLLIYFTAGPLSFLVNGPQNLVTVDQLVTLAGALRGLPGLDERDLPPGG